MNAPVQALDAEASPRAGRLVGPPGTRARRLSAGARKVTLAVHVTVAVAWVGIIVASIVIEVMAITTGDLGVTRAALTFLEVFGRWVFPAAAVSAVASGAVLSLTSKWGFVRYRWMVAKLVLTAGVVVTGAQVTTRLLASAETAVTSAGVGATGTAVAPLVIASAVHLAMLVAATVISYVKPGGRTRTRRAMGRPRLTPPPRSASRPR